MKFNKRKAALTNFIIMLVSVFLVFLVFGTTVSSLWLEEAKDNVFKNDTILLSLVADSLDKVILDTTHAISLMEFDEGFIQSVSNSANNKEESVTFYNLAKSWEDTSRVILAKPYISEIYMFLEQIPQYVLTSEGVRAKNNFKNLLWHDAYMQQDDSINLWAQTLPSNINSSENQNESIYIFRRLPYLMYTEYMDGVVAVRMEREYFNSLIADLPQQEHRNIFILDDKLTQIYSSHESIYTKYIDEGDIKNSQSLNFVKDTNEGEMLISIVNSPSFNWSYISVVPVSSVLEQFSNIRSLVNIFIAISFVICLVLAFFYTAYTYRPIRIMLEIFSVENHSKKDRDYSKDEYGYIIFNFIQTLKEKQEAQENLLREKLLQKEMSQIALQSQINPHFLYNTLEVINWETVRLMGADNNVSKMLVYLAQNLRYMARSNKNMVSLGEDLENLIKYIELQKLFCDDNIEFSLIYKNDANETKVPRLFIQPLIENSILHGMKQMQTGGKIRIKIKKVGNELKVKISDNGCGIAKEKLKQIVGKMNDNNLLETENMGIKNIDSRLKLRFGNNNGLKILAKEGLGTCVFITIPIQ